MKDNNLRAGAGKALIKIGGDILPLDRFIGVSDDLYVRILIIKADAPAAIVSVEMTSLGDESVRLLKSTVADKTGISGEHIWICVSHTFSAPHILEGSMMEKAPEADQKKSKLLQAALLQAAGEAALMASADLRDAALRIGNGSCEVNINRDIPSAQGWWIGRNPEGLSDKTLVVLCFDDPVGKTIGLIYHYGVQASILDGVTDEEGGRRISADLAGEASRVAEAGLGGVAIFLPGASGDQAPCRKARYTVVSGEGRLVEKKNGGDGLGILSELGGELGGAVLHLARDVCRKTDVTELRHSAISLRCLKQKRPFETFPSPSTNFVSVPDGELETEICFLRIGKEAILLGIKPEINCLTALEIRKDSPFQRTLIVQMVNGGQKYLADRESYLKMTYEAMNSSFGIGAAEYLRDQVVTALREAGSGV
jgi:hypothetical protein